MYCIAGSYDDAQQIISTFKIFSFLFTLFILSLLSLICIIVAIYYFDLLVPTTSRVPPPQGQQASLAVVVLVTSGVEHSLEFDLYSAYPEQSYPSSSKKYRSTHKVA